MTARKASSSLLLGPDLISSICGTRVLSYDSKAGEVNERLGACRMRDMIEESSSDGIEALQTTAIHIPLPVRADIKNT